MQLDRVDEIHIAKAGTGGAACARNHHAALTDRALDWREGGWVQQRGGSGRQLAHFPEPVGPRDCYRAGLAEAMVLHRCFPSAGRITARVAATRRDRLTANLPMLRPPHLDGGPGAIRVELWGRRDGAVEVLVYGASGAPSRLAGVMAAVTASLSLAGVFAPGVRSLAEVDDTAAVLATLADLGVTVSVFEGAK